jgi:hypothetical protein
VRWPVPLQHITTTPTRYQQGCWSQAAGQFDGMACTWCRQLARGHTSGEGDLEPLRSSWWPRQDEQLPW